MISSNISSGESNDQVMSLRGFGGGGSDNGNDYSIGASSTNSNILNTPLATTMRKVGINPQSNNKLNQFVVRKSNNTFSS